MQAVAFEVADDMAVEIDLVQVAAAVIQAIDPAAVGQLGLDQTMLPSPKGICVSNQVRYLCGLGSFTLHPNLPHRSALEQTGGNSSKPVFRIQSDFLSGLGRYQSYQS